MVMIQIIRISLKFSISVVFICKYFNGTEVQKIAIIDCVSSVFHCHNPYFSFSSRFQCF